MLRVSLIGNLGSDPETRYTQKGTEMVSFRVAVNQVGTSQEGERQEHTEWFRVRVMGRQAEYAKGFAKGGRVFIEGRLQIGEYTSRDGEKRTSYDVFADEVVSFRTDRPASENGRESDGVARATPARPAASRGETELEDLPF